MAAHRPPPGLSLGLNQTTALSALLFVLLLHFQAETRAFFSVLFFFFFFRAYFVACPFCSILVISQRRFFYVLLLPEITLADIRNACSRRASGRDHAGADIAPGHDRADAEGDDPWLPGTDPTNVIYPFEDIPKSIKG